MTNRKFLSYVGLFTLVARVYCLVDKLNANNGNNKTNNFIF